MKLANLTFENKIAFIEMNNDARLNCLSKEFCIDMIDAIKTGLQEPDCHGIVIRAKKGVKVWSAGHDVHELPLDRRDPISYSTPMEHLLRAVEDAPVPVIALVEGTVWGGACDFCVSCDMIVAADSSTLAITPAKLGIPYNISGVTHFINAIGINRAREMFFTAAPITAPEAFNLGLANHIAPAEHIDAVLEERILAPMRKNSILAISCIKRQFRLLTKESSLISPEMFEKVQGWRRGVYDSDDYREGVRSFLEKRSPVFKGKASDLDSKHISH